MARDRVKHRAAVTAYTKRNPEKRKRWARITHLRLKYGLELHEYEVMFSSQGGVCAICAQPPEEGKVLQVDHDHITGRIRGLLCHKCNKALGLLNEQLESALRYLERYGRAR